MNITETTPFAAITCSGVTLQAPAPYSEGHTLTANEAAVLNQTLSENLRNNFASTIRAAVAPLVGKEKPADVMKADIDSVLDQLDVADLQAKFDAYVSEYEFGVRRSGTSRAPVDPVEKEALAIAKSKVRAALKKKGIAVKDISAEQLTEMATNALDKYPQIREQAAEIVRMKSEVADGDLDLDLG